MSLRRDDHEAHDPTRALAWDDGPAVEGHRLVQAARRLASDVLEPAAAAVDAAVVPRSHLDAIAGAGLLDLLDAPAAVSRRVHEVLAGADLATWFVAVQHAMPLRLAAEVGRADLVAGLARGKPLAGVAFAHLRRGASSPLTATRAADGAWVFRGSAPWYSGWGINDVALIGARSPEGETVFALLPAVDGGRLTASALIEVAAVRAASTVSLTFQGYEVGADSILAILPEAAWLAQDRARSANVVPAVFGVAESALALLHQAGMRPGEHAAVTAANALHAELAAVRQEAYWLLDTVPGDQGRERRLALRARALDLLARSTCALVAAGAGGAMACTSPAQRKAREALFLMVQAQTADARRASLEQAVAGLTGSSRPQ